MIKTMSIYISASHDDYGRGLVIKANLVTFAFLITFKKNEKKNEIK